MNYQSPKSKKYNYEQLSNSPINSRNQEDLVLKIKKLYQEKYQNQQEYSQQILDNLKQKDKNWVEIYLNNQFSEHELHVFTQVVNSQKIWVSFRFQNLSIVPQYLQIPENCILKQLVELIFLKTQFPIQSIQILQKILSHNQCRLQKLKIQKTILCKQKVQILAKAITYTKYLKLLSFDTCSLDDQCTDEICEIMGGCKSLELISLQENHITSKGFQKIARNRPSNITQIYIQNNPLTDEYFQDFQFFVQKKLEFNGCGLSEKGFFRFFQKANLQDCTVLNFSDNLLNSKCVFKMCNFVQNTQVYALQQLGLANIRMGDKGLAFLLETIEKNLQQLKYLDVSYNYISSQGGLNLFNTLQIIQKDVQLKKINISNNQISEEIQQQIINKIKTQEILISIIIDEFPQHEVEIGVGVDTQQLELIEEYFINQNQINLELSILYQDYSQFTVNPILKEQIKKFLNPKIEKNQIPQNKLILDFIIIKDQDTWLINNMIRLLPQIQIISLNNCELENNLIEEFFNIFQNNLTQISFKNNNLTSKNLKILIQNLKYQQNSLDLDLSNNNLNFTDLQEILEFSSQFPVLKNLSIGYNKIIDRQSEKFIQLIRNSQITFESFYLDDNELNFGGICKELGVMNTCLQFLSLQFCRLSDEDSENIKILLQKNQNLKTLYLNNNFFSDFGGNKILAGLNENKVLKYLDLKKNFFQNDFVNFFKLKVIERIQFKLEIDVFQDRGACKDVQPQAQDEQIKLENLVNNQHTVLKQLNSMIQSHNPNETRQLPNVFLSPSQSFESLMNNNDNELDVSQCMLELTNIELSIKQLFERQNSIVMKIKTHTQRSLPPKSRNKTADKKEYKGWTSNNTPLITHTMTPNSYQNDSELSSISDLKSVAKNIDFGNPKATLLNRIGGFHVVENFIQIFFQNIKKNKKISNIFGKIDLKKKILGALIGPDIFKEGLQNDEYVVLNSNEFDQIKQLSIQILQELRVKNAEIEEIIIIIESLRSQFVNNNIEIVNRLCMKMQETQINQYVMDYESLKNGFLTILNKNIKVNKEINQLLNIQQTDFQILMKLIIQTLKEFDLSPDYIKQIVAIIEKLRNKSKENIPNQNSENSKHPQTKRTIEVLSALDKKVNELEIFLDKQQQQKFQQKQQNTTESFISSQNYSQIEKIYLHSQQSQQSIDNTLMENKNIINFIDDKNSNPEQNNHLLCVDLMEDINAYNKLNAYKQQQQGRFQYESQLQLILNLIKSKVQQLIDINPYYHYCKLQFDCHGDMKTLQNQIQLLLNDYN